MHTTIWTMHTPDRRSVWFVCSGCRATLLAKRPGLLGYPAYFRSYCGFCPGPSA